MSNAEERERIYREVSHQYHIEDAQSQVWWYLHAHGVDADGFNIDEVFDLNYLASLFEKYHDCNVAENDMWQEIINEYVRQKEIDIHAYDELQDFEVVLLVTGKYRKWVKASSVEDAMRLGGIAFSEADFGELEDCDGHIEHIEDPNGQYHYCD